MSPKEIVIVIAETVIYTLLVYHIRQEHKKQIFDYVLSKILFVFQSRLTL